MGDLAILGAAFVFGVGSAILPVVLNAEAYVVATAALVDADGLVAAILSLGIGTVAGKALVFVLIRRGSERFRRDVVRRPPRTRVTGWLRRVGDWLLTTLDRPVLGATTVLVSSLLAVPPLAVVTIMAPLSRQPLWIFLVMVFVGRTAQFLAIAFVIHNVT